MKVEIDAPSAARWCKTYRAKENLTQRQLAIRLKTSPGVIGDLECERIRSRRVALAVIALMPADVSGLV